MTPRIDAEPQLFFSCSQSSVGLHCPWEDDETDMDWQPLFTCNFDRTVECRREALLDSQQSSFGSNNSELTPTLDEVDLSMNKFSAFPKRRESVLSGRTYSSTLGWISLLVFFLVGFPSLFLSPSSNFGPGDNSIYVTGGDFRDFGSLWDGCGASLIPWTMNIIAIPLDVWLWWPYCKIIPFTT